MKSSCICRKQSEFDPVIRYRNETVFKAYEGAVIARCRYCRTLKTFPSKNNRAFDPVCTKADLYEGQVKRFEKLFAPVVSRIKKYSPGKRVLDVGCSTGILLNLLQKKHFDVRGIEPNAKACRKARSRLPGRVHQGTLATFLKKYKTKSDCIIYNHVMEHIPDPAREVARAKSALMPGGLLVVGVPNTDNWIFRIRGKYWESLLPNEHIWQMNTHDLCGLLEKNGFVIREVSFEDDPRQDYGRAKQIYFRFLSLLNRISGTGEAVLIIAEKRKG